MFKLLRYELKARNKVILPICIIMILVNLLTIISFPWTGLISSTEGFSFSGNADLGSTSSMLMLMAIGIDGISLIIAVVMAIRILLKDIFSDSGKLLFMLPKKGYALVGAKLISAAGEFLIYFSIILVFLALHIMKIVQAAEVALGETLYLMNDLIYIVILTVIWYVYTIVIAYFSIILFRSIIKTKNLAKVLAAVAFIVLNSVFGAIETLLKNAVPIYIEFQKFVIESVESESITQTSVIGLVFKIVVAIMLFIISANIMEKKVEI